MHWWQDVVSLRSSLKWYRSWPREIPAGRAYVQDNLPRLLMSDCDYNTVEEWPEDDPGLCLLEWDMALDLRERTTFAEIAERNPDKPLVAPYYKSYGGAIKIVHRSLDFEDLEEGYPKTDLAGFGCIYLPQKLLREFLATNPTSFTDVTFSDWHYFRHGQIDVTWDVHPQHLHE